MPCTDLSKNSHVVISGRPSNVLLYANLVTVWSAQLVTLLFTITFYFQIYIFFFPLGMVDDMKFFSSDLNSANSNSIE